MEAMIFSAGLGTRLQQFTCDRPKALVEINGKTLLEININRLISYGFNHIVINIHHFADQMVEFLNNHTFNAKIFISDERNELLDTGGGLLKALPLFSRKNPILLHNVDVLSNLNLTDVYHSHLKSSAMASLAVSKRDTSRYFLFCEDRLCGWKNYSTGQIISDISNEGQFKELAFSGIHVINPDLCQFVKHTGKFSMTELYLDTYQNFEIKSYVHDAKDWLDVGTPKTLEMARTFILESMNSN